MKNDLKKQRGFSLVELMIGMTLIVVVIGIGYRAMISINRQQTAAANKAARQAAAESTKNAVLDYLGGKCLDPATGDLTLECFDAPGTTGVYWLAFNPENNSGTANQQNDHLALNQANKTVEPTYFYLRSKIKVKVDIRKPEPPIFDRRTIITVSNVDEAKGGRGYKEEEVFEYYLVRPRTSASGGTVRLQFLNGSKAVGGDPDGVPYNGGTGVVKQGVSRIKVEVSVGRWFNPDGSTEFGKAGGWWEMAKKPFYGRSGSDGRVAVYGIPRAEGLYRARFILNERGSLTPYYGRNCGYQFDQDSDAQTLSKSDDCNLDPAAVWESRQAPNLYFVFDKDTDTMEFGTIHVWPYAKVTVRARDADPPFGLLPHIGFRLQPVQVETKFWEDANPIWDPAKPNEWSPTYLAWGDQFTDQTDVTGEKSVFVIPGYYYRAVYGSVTPKEEKQDPDRSNDNPDVDRNNDPGDVYPYGIVDKAGAVGDPAPPKKYGAPILGIGEKSIINKHKFPPAADGTDYPHCFRVKSGETYDVGTGEINATHVTNLRLRPMGDIRAQLRVARSDGLNNAKKFVDALAPTLNASLILNVYNEFNKVYRPDEDDELVSADASFVFDKMSYSKLWKMAAGRTGAAGFVDIPNICMGFFDLTYRSGATPDQRDQFEHSSYPILFPHGWAGDYAPILIMSHPDHPDMQLYSFWHGKPEPKTDPNAWLNGRPDGKLFSVNPNPTAFPNHEMAGVLQGYHIVGTGAEDWAPNLTDDPYLWFRNALRCTWNSPDQTYRVMPRSELSAISGKLVEMDGVTLFWWDKPATISTWGVEYTVGDDPTAPGSEGFVNFDYKTVVNPNGDYNYYYQIPQRVVPTLIMRDAAGTPLVDGTPQKSFGNGRVIKASLIRGAGGEDRQVMSPMDVYEKKFDATRAAPLTKFYFSTAAASNVLPVTNPQIQVRTMAGTLIQTSHITNIPNTLAPPRSEFHVQGQHFFALLNQVIAGQTTVMAVPPGIAPGDPVLSNIDIPVEYTGAERQNYFTRFQSASHVDWKSPDDTITGTLTTYCDNWVGPCPYGIPLIGNSPFMGVRDKLYAYKILQPASTVVTVRDTTAPGWPFKPDIIVTLYTSSLKEYQSSGRENIWRKRCTAKTNGSGTIDYLHLDPSQLAGVPASPDCGAGAGMLKFDGFTETAGDLSGSGVKNIKVVIENMPPGKSTTDLLEVDAVDGTAVSFPIYLINAGAGTDKSL